MARDAADSCSRARRVNHVHFIDVTGMRRTAVVSFTDSKARARGRGALTLDEALLDSLPAEETQGSARPASPCADAGARAPPLRAPYNRPDVARPKLEVALLPAEKMENEERKEREEGTRGK